MCVCVLLVHESRQIRSGQTRDGKSQCRHSLDHSGRPFRYDRNQIPYDYTVEVRNRFKGLDLIDRVPDELWMEVHDIV